MIGKSIGGAVLAGAALVAAGVLGLRALLGGGPPVVAGMALGFGLGAGGAALEVVLTRRALAREPGRALHVVLAGMGLRLVVLMLLTVAFHSLPSVNETAFALAFVGGFLASLPAVGVVSGAHRASSSGSPGKEVHG